MNEEAKNAGAGPIPAGPPTEPVTATAAAVNEGSPAMPSIRLAKILVPVDFSDASRKALRYASAFAAQFQAKLFLVHVVEFNVVGSDFGLVELSQIEADMRESAVQRLADWLKHEVGAGISVDARVQCGRPYLEILETAKTEDVDLILIASHGHSSLAHVVLGSTVERIVRHAPCPVLVVRPAEHEFV